MTKLLFDEYPIIVPPSLAGIIGINEAIVLQQIHYWIDHNKRSNHNFREGRYWTWNTLDEWLKQFPWMSMSTLRRVIKNLENQNLVISEKPSAKNWHHTKHYSLNYEAIERLRTPEKSDLVNLNKSDCSEGADHYRDYSSETNSKNELIKDSHVKHFDEMLCTREEDFFEKPPNKEEPWLDKQVSNSTNPPVNVSGLTSSQSTGSSVPRFSLANENSEWVVTIDDEGWLKLPTAKKFKLARFLAVRRTQFLLGMDVCPDTLDWAYADHEGRSVQKKGRQLGLQGLKDGELEWEDAMLAKGSNKSLKALRNYAIKFGNMGQEHFNWLLCEMFNRSLEWCKEHKKDAIAILRERPIPSLFYAEDKQYILGGYR